MIVTDANLLAYLILPGDRTADAEAVLAKDPAWVAPSLLVSELRSVVHKYIVRGDITVAQGTSMLLQARQVLDGREVHVDSRSVLELALRSKCSTYDCEYVALAIALEVPLVTSDKALLRAFPDVAQSPTLFVETAR